MKNILLLSKVLFINNLGANYSTKKNKKQMSSIGFIVLMAILIAIVALPMAGLGFMYELSFRTLGAMNDISRDTLLIQLFNLILPFAVIFIIFFSIFSVISTFFLANDNEILLGLPFKPKEIIIAKFINSLTSTYLIELMLFVPILIGIGLGAFMNPLYYLNVLIVSIFLPFIPLSVLGIIITSVMRYSVVSKVKDKIQYFIMSFAIVFAIGIQFVSQSMGSSLEGSEEEIIDLITNSSSLLSQIFFFIYPASYALGSSNILLSILASLGFALVSIGFLFLFALIGDKIYIKGILGKPQIKSKKEKLEKVEIEEENSSLFKNMVKNEWRMMFRSPTFNMNLISTVLIVPIILIISFAFGFSEGSEGISFIDLISSLKDSINLNSGYAISFAIAIFSFFTCFSPIASTAISRDGKHAWTNKVLPIKPMTIIHAKMFWGIVLGMLPVVFISLLLTITGFFTIIDFILINLPIFFLVIATNYIGIMIDLARPKTEWDNEQIAVKQNINSFYFMLIDWGLTVLLAGIGVILLFIKIPAFVASLIISLILLTLCVILYKLLSKKGMAIFKNIG